MADVELANEKGEIVNVSKAEKERLLTAVGREAAAGLKYVMCMAEASGRERAGISTSCARRRKPDWSARRHEIHHVHGGGRGCCRHRTRGHEIYHV